MFLLLESLKRVNLKCVGLMVLFVFLVPTCSFACTCVDETLWPGGRPVKQQVADARRQSNAVFSGVVTGLDLDETTHMYRAHFTVYESWKGVHKKEITIVGVMVLPCTYTFKVGETYLVYAIRRERHLEASFCQTKFLRYADVDRNFLGKGKRFSRNGET